MAAREIPIRNLYHMLCYAWNELPEGGFRYVASDEVKKPIDLLARMVIDGIKHVQRRGIDQGYNEFTEELRRLRGRVLVAESERRMLLNLGRAICVFDELSPDTLPNQILLATLKRIVFSADVAKSLRHDASTLIRGLRDVSHIRLTGQIFRRVQLHGNNRYYRYLLHVCELLFSSSLIDDRDGAWRFRDFTRDESKMANLFERFLFHFYEKEQSDYRVKRDQIDWYAESANDPEMQFLPKMMTDISLRSADHTLIMDAKFYRRTLNFRFKETVRSGHLYQMFSYLKNLEARGGNDAIADGMLVYPTVDQNVSLDYTMGNHTIRFETVDLGCDWGEIETRLMSLLDASATQHLPSDERSAMSFTH